MIQIKNISKSFGKLTVLDAIDLKIPPARSIAIIGPNGSGKTTLIKCILGLVQLEQGEIKYDHKAIKNVWHYRSHISYLPQLAQFPNNLSVNELLKVLKGLRPGPTRTDELIELFEIGSFLHKKFNALSGGMKQKVNILTSLMYDSPTIILDEPTTGLDPVSQVKLKNYLQQERKNGKCILLTTHILSLLDELCDMVLFLLEGQVRYFGSTSDLKQKTGAKTIEEAVPILMHIDIDPM